MCGLCQGFELSKLENESNSLHFVTVQQSFVKRGKAGRWWMLWDCWNWRRLSLYTSCSLYSTVFCVVAVISCMYCLAYLPPNIFVCTRPGEQVDTLLNWSLQNSTVPIFITMKNGRVLSSFVVAFVYDLRVCHCSRWITKVKKDATLISVYQACVHLNAGLPNFLQEVFFHAMLQTKLDKPMCFSKQLISLLNIWSLLIFQQLSSTAAATSMIVSAVLIVSSIRIFLFLCIYQGAEKSLARPGRKQATVTKL